MTLQTDEQENKDREDFKEWYLNHDSNEDDPSCAWWDIVFDYFKRYHIEPLQKEITEAVKIAEGFQSERDSYKRIAYKQKTEIESLQSEITRLNLELDSFAIEFTNWISDNNWEGSDMVGVWEKVIDPYFSKALTTAELLELYKETMNTKI